MVERYFKEKTKPRIIIIENIPRKIKQTKEIMQSYFKEKVLPYDPFAKDCLLDIIVKESEDKKTVSIFSILIGPPKRKSHDI